VIGTTEGRSEAIHPAIHGAGLAVANIPHCYCTFFTIGAARQPSLIAFGERFKVLEFGPCIAAKAARSCPLWVLVV
jgi:hypothetical protein